MKSIIAWRGLSTSGLDVCLVVSIGGNRKTKKVLELSLIPTTIIENWTELTKGIPKFQQGAIYVTQMRALLDGVCPGSCIYVKAGKGCYVQHNARNAGQVARIIRDILPAKLKAVSILDILIAAKFEGIVKVRSMVAGDAAMIPANVWGNIEKQILAKFPVEDWLAYTHAWATAKHLQSTHVASCDSIEEATAAGILGWNVFQVIAPIGEAVPKGAALCPASKEFKLKRGFSISCNGCPMACNGASAKTWRAIPRHSSGDASRKAAAARRGETLTNNKGRIVGLYA